MSFTTETYEGDYGGGNHDGADGMSFFLVDDSYVESDQSRDRRLLRRE